MLPNMRLLLPSLIATAFGAATLTAVAAGAPADSARTLAPLAFTKTVFATAKDIPAPVAFSIDEMGVVYTANSLRYDGHGLFDNRQYPIVPDDVTSTSVADRRRLTEK